MEESDGTCEGTTDTTMIVQIEEEKCAIHKLPFMTVQAPVRSVLVQWVTRGEGDSLRFLVMVAKSTVVVQRSKRQQFVSRVITGCESRYTKCVPDNDPARAGQNSCKNRK